MVAGDESGLALAAQSLAHGSLVALPTETVYGLGARADDDQAVARIFSAKGRPSDHPLIVHVADAQAARAFASQLPEPALRLMQAFWPGPLTVIVPRAAGVGEAAAGGQSSIGLRCPSHPVALALLRQAAALGVPGVAAPSANRFGRVSPTTAAHVVDEFAALAAVGLIVVDGGACQVGIESTIVDCTRGQPALLRPGMVTREAIEQVLGHPLVERDAFSPRASGTLEAHYAPTAKVRLMSAAQIRQGLQVWSATEGMPTLGVYSRSLSRIEAGPAHRFVGMPDSAEACARELFAVLRRFDEAGVQWIWVEDVPLGAAWEGVRDRLLRAAAA
jgi:L-threonylcarbamoyladenylate synthase